MSTKQKLIKLMEESLMDGDDFIYTIANTTTDKLVQEHVHVPNFALENKIEYIKFSYDDTLSLTKSPHIMIIAGGVLKNTITELHCIGMTSGKPITYKINNNINIGDKSYTVTRIDNGEIENTFDIQLVSNNDKFTTTQATIKPKEYIIIY